VKKVKKATAKKTANKMRPAKAGKAAKKAAKTIRTKKAGKKKATKKVAPRKIGGGWARALVGSVPDHRCQRTLEPGICLKFFFNPRSGEFDQPLGGERVPCSECQHFF
jgi:hypothetical protein